MQYQNRASTYQNYLLGRVNRPGAQTAEFSGNSDESQAERSWRAWNEKTNGMGKGKLNQTQSAQIAADIEKMLADRRQTAKVLSELIAKQGKP